MSTIIVGVDESQGSRDAIALASTLAGITGSTLMFVNVFPYDLRPSRALNSAGHAKGDALFAKAATARAAVGAA